MIYLRKLFTQDLRDGKQIAFPKEPSLQFFNFDFSNGDPERRIKFRFNAEDSQYPQYDGKVIQTRLYPAGSEARIDGELKAFIRDFMNAKVEDILCFSQSGKDTYEFKFIQQGTTMYPLYLQLINSQNHTVVFNKNTEKDIFSKDTLQIIYYGAPGTGKSHTINEITEQQPKENVFRTTFHPDSDYSTFVGCYKPTTIEVPMRDVTGKIIKENGADVTENRIVYKFVPQSFTKAYLRAWLTTEPVYLVIEEINRGNCAQIFGDLFQLLDRKRDGFSEYPIKADNDLATYISEKLSASTRTDIPDSVRSGEELSLPSNLYIWATMNTSDQSLFPIDSAFKRRWDWKYVPIVQGYDKGTGMLLEWKIKVGDKEYDWWKFLQAINKQIGDTTKSEDKKLGYFFCKAENGIVSAETFVGKVLFYLWNDVYKDYDHSPSFFRDENGLLIEYGEYYAQDIASHNAIPNIKLVQSFIEKVEPEFKADISTQETDN